MLKNWLSRYNLRYPRSIAYMLQASEYDIRDYLAWYRGTKNFFRIEKRKQFVKTPKALLVLAVGWFMVFLLLIAAVLSLRFIAAPLNYVLFFAILILLPSLVAYGIIVPLLLIKFLIQKPIEYFVIRKSRQIIKNHKAVKIAIAGSFGKTTMREILKTVLSEGKKVAAPPGSYNTPLGISQFVKSLKGDEDVLIFEFGEYYPGDVRQLCELVHPDLGVIAGINEAHLQKFKTLERTVKTIYELADYLGDKPLYVNGENKLALNNAHPDHIIYSRNGVACPTHFSVGDMGADGWKIENQKTDLAGTFFVMIKNGVKVDLKSGLLGLHQIGPLAAAADIALKLGLSFNQVKAGIGKTKPFEHRMEPKTDSSGIVILDDSYNGNPDGVKAVIDFLVSLSGFRRFYVTPGLVEMGARKEEVHKQIGKSLAKAKIEKVILIKNSVTPYIEAGLKEAGYSGEIIWFNDALAAFSALPHLTVKGDIILLQNDWPDQYR